MGTLSQSVKKLKRMEEEIFAMRLHLDKLRGKLKEPKYIVGVDYAKDSTTYCSGYMNKDGVLHIKNDIY